MMQGIIRASLLFLSVSLVISNVEAQQRPLVTEDPETIGSGLILIEGGVDYLREQSFPVSGLVGNLIRFPLVGVGIGVSSIAEIQLDGLSYNQLSITDRQVAPLSALVNSDADTAQSIEDLVIGTKVRFFGETESRPSFGFRFATRLPNASNESGLGLDTMDFFATFLIGKTIESVRVVGNAGVGILADPTRGDRQNDVFLYGISVARAIAQGIELVGEINGRINTRKGEPPPGTGSRSTMRFGARYTKGPVRIDSAVLAGITSRDQTFGVTAGFTWVFEAFQIP